MQFCQVLHIMFKKISDMSAVWKTCCPVVKYGMPFMIQDKSQLIVLKFFSFDCV
jgi:hypothetical protein